MSAKEPTSRGANDERVLKAVCLGLLLAGSAYAMAQAMEGPGRWWLGWIALLPLFLCIRVLPPIGAGLAGAFWGASLFSFAVLAAETLVTPSIDSFVLLATVPAVYGFAGARMTRQIGFSPLLLALGWVGVEFALGPLGLRYGLLASTQGDGVVLRAIGSFAGYLLVSFLVAYVNAALLSVLARVPAELDRARVPRGLGGDASPIVWGDSWAGVVHSISPAQPRAPPV